MIKHVGRHNNKKVLILYREVPDEEHMCLVVYSDSLPTKYHDTIMPILESQMGQNAEPFADALHRNLTQDGRNILGCLHHEGFIKKVNSSQVIVTPTAVSQIRLDELNNILNEMKNGEAAVKKMAQLDANRGLKGTNENAKKHVDETMAQYNSTHSEAPAVDVLDDSALANSYIAQAERMERESQALLVEAGRLKDEAKKLLPAVKEEKPKATRTRRVSNGKKTEAKV
jgi:hypothetical protein